MPPPFELKPLLLKPATIVDVIVVVAFIGAVLAVLLGILS